MVKLKKRRQREDESIDKFLDDLEMLRERSNPGERISEMNVWSNKRRNEDHDGHPLYLVSGLRAHGR